GEAVGAAMLAPAISVDRPLEADIGTVISGDDGLGALDMLNRLEHRHGFHNPPAIIETVTLVGFKPAGMIALRATAANSLGLHQFAARQIGVAAATETFKGFK